MEIAGIQKIDCPHFALTVKTNPEAVEVYEEALIPAEYMRHLELPPSSPDKTVIKAAIKSGIDVPGATLGQTKRLEIK